MKAEIIHTRQQLPSAPKAARGPNADIEKVPLDPPFILRISNVPFTTTDGEVARLLSVNINVEVMIVFIIIHLRIANDCYLGGNGQISEK